MADEDEIRRELRCILDAALAAADAGRAISPALPHRPKGRVLIAGAGKAAATMAAAVEAAWEGDLDGHVVTQTGFGLPLSRIRLTEASHPLPGLEAQAAAAETLVRASMLTADDLLLVLLSGGGSALWPAPRRPLTLDMKRALTTSLLKSGAPIAEVNALRKHISRIKGGRLAKAAGPCSIVALAVSDVPGDDPSLIASGPVSPDPSTLEEARDIVRRHGIPMSDELRAVLDDPASETPKPGDPCFDRVDYRIVLKPRGMLAAAAAEASRLGYEPVLLGADLEGEARDVGKAHAAVALATVAEGRRVALISGGELTVTVTGHGSGGPNREYALGLAMALKGADGIAALAADSDGQDGAPGAAGACVLPSTLTRARALRLDPGAALAINDSGPFFSRLGDEIVTGPTGTNVNDVRVILIRPSD
ncbi:Putative hydroxypyruvate reductase [Alphaproteobacteria bacterium SO-S41]|nr:Putative hydroxypyruvate reductase [Alphaproteobacteria bacterium SO-S41]